MSMMNERWMEIAFRSVRKIRFQFPIQAKDESMAARIEEVLKLPSLSISAEKFSMSFPRALSR